MVTILLYYADYYNFFGTFDFDQTVFINFAKVVESKYNPVPYHNKDHAADITQTLFYFINYGELNSTLSLTEHDIMCLIISGAVHDMEHPGFNNGYLINAKDKLAITYNDKSVLENYHISSTFRLLLNKETNIFAGFDENKYKQTRQKMISMVLATDNAHHFVELSSFKAKVRELKNDNKLSTAEPNDKLMLISNCVHFADLSNLGKRWEIGFKWSELLFDEFFAQGDLERKSGLPIGFLMDRYTTNIATNQVGFINVFVKPCFDALADMLPNIKLNVENIEKAIEKWKSLENHYDEKLKQLNARR